MSKPRDALDWVLAQHPDARVHLPERGILLSHLEGWVVQRGYPNYRVVMTGYDSKSDTHSWNEYAISRSGRVYVVRNGHVEPDPIWKP